MPANLDSSLRALLRGQAPHLDPARARLLGRGADADAFVLPARGDAAPHTVLRMPRHAQSAARLAVEPPLLAALAAAGVPALPRESTALVETSGDPADAFRGTLHRYAPGTPPPRPLRGAARARLARQVAGFLSALHRFPPERALGLGVRRVDLWEDEYAPLLRQMHERPPGEVSAPTRARLDRAGRALRQSLDRDAGAAVLLHGDLQRGHLLVAADGQLTCVIDWSYTMVADAALDMAGVGFALGWPFAEQVLAAYTPPPHVRTDAAFIDRARGYLALADLYGIAYLSQP